MEEDDCVGVADSRAACFCAALAHADAAYPGQNGKIAYAMADGLKTIEPGRHRAGPADTTRREDLDPVWSPDGQRVAFRHRSHTGPVYVDERGRYRRDTADVDSPNEIGDADLVVGRQRIVFTMIAAPAA